MISYKFIVNGRVQGVYYRKNIQEKAIDLNFSGYVKNLSDGTVEAVVTCEPERVDAFIEILKEGSPKSVVKNIKQFDCNEEYRGKFQIDY